MTRRWRALAEKRHSLSMRIWAQIVAGIVVTSDFEDRIAPHLPRTNPDYC